MTVNLRSNRTSSLTCAVLSLVRVADGRPLRCSSSTRVLPSENIFCQQKACALDTSSSPKACWRFPRVVVALWPSLTQKKMAYDTTGTYSTMSHCKAMPLQVGIEEGSRSTAVCVSGLQYCQYSQEKISLITLLSDHVLSTVLQLPMVFRTVTCCTSL